MSLYDYLTKDEKRLISVLETAIRNARSIEEVKEAKYCIGITMYKIVERVRQDK